MIDLDKILKSAIMQATNFREDVLLQFLFNGEIGCLTSVIIVIIAIFRCQSGA
jgi:hypothetical protein